MKIKSIIKKIFIYGITASVLLVISSFVYSSKAVKQYPDYTSYNTEARGVKALYLLTQRMGFNVSRFERMSRFMPDNTTMVVIKPDIGIFNLKSEKRHLKSWIERGNSLVLIGDTLKFDDYKLNEITAAPPIVSDKAGNNSIYLVGSGKLILMGDAESYTNAGIGVFSPGIVFIKVLEGIRTKNVQFNEYYHGIEDKGFSIADILGQTGILVLLQVLIAAAVLMFIKSRKFGRSVVAFETVKRIENENLYALSNIYMKARANTIVLENYLTGFKKELARFLGFNEVPANTDLVLAARQDNYLAGQNIKAVLDSCDEYIEMKKMSSRKLKRLIERIEEIGKGIK